MRILLFFVLSVSLFSCGPQEDTLSVVDTLYRDYEIEPNQERAQIFLDSLASLVGQRSEDRDFILPYLEKGVKVSITEGRLSTTPGYLLPLLRNYPKLENRKNYLINLGDVMHALRKPHASNTVYMELINLYPNDKQVREKRSMIDAFALAQEDYLIYLFNQLSVNPDEMGLNRGAALRYVDAVEAKALTSPQDPAIPGHLYGAAEVARSMRTFPKAMSLYDWLLEDYPDNDKAPNVLFIKGFILEQDFQDDTRAKATYQEFLTKYPDHQMAESAQFLLDNLGKSDEEILVEIEKKRKAQK